MRGAPPPHAVLALASCAAVLHLASCEAAKLRPWISYTESSGSTIGVNDDSTRFVNNPMGAAWQIGLAFEIPLGGAPDVYPIVVREWPRAALDTRETTGAGRAPARDVVVVDASSDKPDEPEPDLLGKGLSIKQELDETSWAGLMKVLAFCAGGLLLAAGAAKVWRTYKGSE